MGGATRLRPDSSKTSLLLRAESLVLEETRVWDAEHVEQRGHGRARQVGNSSLRGQFDEVIGTAVGGTLGRRLRRRPSRIVPGNYLEA